MTQTPSNTGAVGQGSENGLQPEAVFQTPLWIRRVVGFEAINQEILSHLPALRELGGEQRSNDGGWHSPSRLHLDDRLGAIRKTIGNTCAQCAVTMEFDFSRFDLVFQEMWLNVNGPGHSNKAHVHPGAFLSGAYYVQVPELSGNIEFYDPVAARVASPFPTAAQSAPGATMLSHACSAGDLVIFPGWLQHGVQANRSGSDRISISFNMVHRHRDPQ
jgi:uncharacterized protein (TIGR02466 family)